MSDAKQASLEKGVGVGQDASRNSGVPTNQPRTINPLRFDHARLPEKLDDVVKTGLLTRRSMLPGTEEIERPAAARRQRAVLLDRARELLRLKRRLSEIPAQNAQATLSLEDEASSSEVRFKKNLPDDLRAINEEKKAIDFIAKEFLMAQREVNVDLGGLGVQTARYVVLSALAEKPPGLEEEIKVKPPIFLIPGVSNDLEGIGSLGHELALQGRQVVMVAYPEAWKGRVTKEFAQAAQEVVTSDNYEPFTKFFEGAIDNILQDPDFVKQNGVQQSIELWGYSTGANLVADILRDEKYQKMTTDAVLISPGSCMDQRWIYLKGYLVSVPWGGCQSAWTRLREF